MPVNRDAVQAIHMKYPNANVFGRPRSVSRSSRIKRIGGSTVYYYTVQMLDGRHETFYATIDGPYTSVM